MSLKTLLPILVTAVLTLYSNSAFSQCSNNNFAMSSDTICGNEVVTFMVVNPNPNLTYFWNFGQGGGVSDQGDTVSYAYPARDVDRNYNITAFNGQGTCIQVLTVLSTPDASLNPLSGTLVDDHTIAFCGSTSDFPEFDLTVQNTSTTTNTNYTIDWGDGSPVWSSNTFSTANHVYLTQGQFTLTLTVDGNMNCPAAVEEFLVFNSSDPGGSIVNTTNTVTTCYPNTIGYPILGTENNISGTSYDISISGVPVAHYDHPPPDTFYHTFNETSCDQGTFPFDDDEFVIQMTVTSPCQDKLSFVTARLGTPPLAGFDMVPSVICPGETITMTNTSDGSLNSQELCAEIVGANWMIVPRTYTIISGDTLNSESLEIQPLEQVDYTITMWVENMCGADTAEQVATVGIVPVADAIAVLDQPNFCAPAIATFTNLSTVDPSVTYSWSVTPSNGASFINGTNSSTFEPEIEFTGAELYTVTLTASNDCGAPTWDTAFDIRSKPGIDIPSIGNLCVDTFIYNSNVIINGNPDVVNWTFNGGNPASFTGPIPPAVIFAGTGTYSIIVNASNSCGDSTSTISFDLSDPIPIDAGPDFMACFNESPISLGGSPSGGTWSGQGILGGTDVFDPGNTTSQFITLSYTVDNGICSVSDDLIVEVVGLGSISAGLNDTVCINDPVFDLTGESPVGGLWIGNGIIDPVNGTFDAVVAGLGDHQIGYVVTEPTLSCSDTAYVQITVLDIPPIVLGTESNACVGALVTLSTDVVPGATAVWDFGDGDTDTGFSVGHIFRSEATFVVTVTVSAGQGCSHTDSTLIHAIASPNALFTLTNPVGCNGLVVDFVNESTGNISEYLWEFGIDSLTSTAQTPASVIYPAGTENDTVYTVTLTATGFCGPQSHTEQVFVNKPPVALFGTNVNSICPGEELFFNNLTFNNPTSYLWDFGNGNTSTDAIPTGQFYPTPTIDSTFVITLIAYNQCGSDTITREILVSTVNVVSFFNTDPLSGCAPLEVNFVNFSSLDAFPIWDFGDGNTSTLDSVTHTFIQDGIYTVSLAVDNGCSKDTSYVDINVLASPDITFHHPELGCELAAIPFSNQSTAAFGYAWDFGDGNISNDVNPHHTYAIAGTYTINLFGENSNGCTAFFESDISILAKPTADFDADLNNFCVGTVVNFSNMSSGGENYLWDFGDGTISYDENPEKRYSQEGIYDVSLVVNSDNFCFDTITYPGVVEVFPIPNANFDYVQTVEGIEYGEVEFTNLSLDAQGYSWDFGDGLSSIDTDPIHQYTESGQYPVTLAAENAYGCYDTVLRFVEVDFFGKLFVPNAFSPALGVQSEASLFLPKGVALDQYELQIYSSYGELLWSNNELNDGRPAVGWDGTYNGKSLPQDVYVWKIRATFDNGITWKGAEVDEGVLTTVGTLTLIR